MLSHLPCAVFNPHASPRDPTALDDNSLDCKPSPRMHSIFSVSDIAILNNYKTRKPK